LVTLDQVGEILDEYRDHLPVTAHIAEDVAAFVDHDRIVVGTQRVIAERVALTADQVAEYGLPTAPPKRSDSRSQSWRGETCQLEAFAPDDLADLIGGAISAWFDREVLARQTAAEARDRQDIRALMPSGDGRT
jgi:hypothetical protein